MANEEQALRDTTEKSLVRMQVFDPETLVREGDLGKKNFRDAVLPAKRLIELYNRLSPTALQDFPPDVLNTLQSRANQDFQLFSQVTSFDVDASTAQRDQIINNIRASYSTTFTTLSPLIAYSLHRSADFARLDSQARAALQGIHDQAEESTKDLKKAGDDAKQILKNIREAAAEAGVTQQAEYFKRAAEIHDAEAKSWKTLTYRVAIGVGIYAVLSLFLHKIPWLAPKSAYDAVQLTVSKILIFGVLSYVLYLAARNFLSHQHNAIINAHRQNALLTYKAIADAAGNSPNREVILTHAAACIFSPQPTGYSTDGAGTTGPGVKSVVEMLTRPAGSSTT